MIWNVDIASTNPFIYSQVCSTKYYNPESDVTKTGIRRIVDEDSKDDHDRDSDSDYDKDGDDEDSDCDDDNDEDSDTDDDSYSYYQPPALTQEIVWVTMEEIAPSLKQHFPHNKATLKDLFQVFGPKDELGIAARLEPSTQTRRLPSQIPTPATRRTRIAHFKSRWAQRGPLLTPLKSNMERPCNVEWIGSQPN